MLSTLSVLMLTLRSHKRFLYMFYGFYDAAWQTCVYWFMGALTNNGRKLANYAGTNAAHLFTRYNPLNNPRFLQGNPIGWSSGHVETGRS